MNITGKYLKVWKIEDRENFKIVDLGDSNKNQDGSYNNFTWYRCLLVSSAGQLQINEKDTITIKSGIVTMEKYQDKWSPKIVVFDAEVIASTQNSEPINVNFDSNGSSTFEDDVPF